MTSETPATPSSPSRSSLILQLVRSACHLITVVIVAIWAFADWAWPWPGLLTGIGFTILAILIWALFLSPKPVLHTDRFGQGLIELLFLASGVGAMLALGVHWVVALVFGIVAAVVGYLAPSRLTAA
ncbi:YrdB family protein [Leucobacter sp. W1478]|uniref:YrdB family protein n=1 Tax=Leucobacter sp. W1478 TaxID=3439065 RepID=UPI003F2AF6E1